jgi:uncharacterized protein (DUF1684 family)
MNEARERIATFRIRREEQAREAKGSLALVLTQWVDDAQEIWGVPGSWSPRTDGLPGLSLSVGSDQGVLVNGELVDGTVVLDGPAGDAPAAIVFSETRQGTIIGEAGLFALRVWDSQSDEIQRFGGIDSYEYSPDWVLTGEWKPNPEGTVIEMDKKSGSTSVETIPGEIEFTHDGHTVSLITVSTGRALQIVFADETNGVESYSVGRFLFVVPNPDGTVTLDFNLAVLPPCAFSYSFNCPIPPKQNRLPFAVRAGEKNVVDVNGELLHA